MKTIDIKNNKNKFEGVLLKPRITEKASDKVESGVYVFDVDLRVNKIQIKNAIKKIYNVDVAKVNILKVPLKNVMSRGKKGVKKGGKKALVYLKHGDKIEVI